MPNPEQWAALDAALDAYAERGDDSEHGARLEAAARIVLDAHDEEVMLEASQLIAGGRAVRCPACEHIAAGRKRGNVAALGPDHHLDCPEAKR